MCSEDTAARYASVVHTDFRSAKSAVKFLPHVRSNFGGRVMLINAWRNISDDDPVYNDSLACCDQSTVREGDYVPPLRPGKRCEDNALSRSG